MAGKGSHDKVRIRAGVIISPHIFSCLSLFWNQDPATIFRKWFFSIFPSQLHHQSQQTSNNTLEWKIRNLHSKKDHQTNNVNHLLFNSGVTTNKKNNEPAKGNQIFHPLKHPHQPGILPLPTEVPYTIRGRAEVMAMFQEVLAATSLEIHCPNVWFMDPKYLLASGHLTNQCPVKIPV